MGAHGVRIEQANGEAAMKKEEVLRLLGDLPDEFPPDELMYRLYLKQKMDHAEAAATAGDVFTHEEVVRISDEWLR